MAHELPARRNDSISILRRKTNAINWRLCRSKILFNPFSLDVVAPIADVPFAPGAESAEFVRAAIDRNVDDRKTIVRVARTQRGRQLGGTPATMYGLHAGNRICHLHVV